MAINRVDEFIFKLKSLTSEDEIKLLCEDELIYLRRELGIQYKLGELVSDDLQHLLDIKYEDDIKDPIELIGNSGNAIKQQCVIYRNAIKTLPLNSQNSYYFTNGNGDTITRHIALKYFNINKIEKLHRVKQSVKRSRNDQRNRPSFNPVTAINKAIELLDSRSYVDKILGLYLLTGRRHTEILATLKIHQFDSNTIIDELIEDWLLEGINTIVISGLVKQKDKPYTTEHELIPVLCDPKKIIETINWLRENKPQTKLDDYYQEWLETGTKPIKKPRVTGSKELGERCKKHFQDIIPSPSGKDGDYLNPHNLRSAYCAILYELYNMSEFKTNECNFMVFVNSIIRHKSVTNENSEAYDDYSLNDEDKATLKDI
jgi:hypothetical protein